MSIGIVVPVLNDSENLERLLSKMEIIAPFAKIFVIDDLSTDGSVDVVKKHGAILPYTFEKRGLGRSYAEGIARAVYEYDSEIVFILDADHSPEYIPLMLKKLYEENLDMVIGFERESRTLTSKGASKIAKNLLGLEEFEQPTCGFMLFTSDLIKKIELRKLKSRGDFYHLELLYHAKKAGAKIGQLEFSGHKHESSSMRRVFAWLRDLMLLKMREVWYKYE